MGAMDYLAKKKRKCCLVFTQWDQYKDYVAANGGLPEVLRTKIPIIYGAYLVRSKVECLTVAAVADTKVVHDDGGSRRVPASGFKSEGLGDVVDWLVKSTAGMRWWRLLQMAAILTAILLVLLGGCKVYNDYISATRNNEIKHAEDKAYQQWQERIKSKEAELENAKKVAGNIRENYSGRWDTSLIDTYDDFIVYNNSMENIHNAIIKVWHKEQVYESSSIPIISTNSKYTWSRFAYMPSSNFDRSTVKWCLNDCSEYQAVNEKNAELDSLRKEFSNAIRSFTTQPESRN